MFAIIAIYFTTLFIAPQLWIEPFIGLRTDYIFFPIWMMYAFTRPTRLELTAQDKFLIFFFLWMIISMVLNGFGDNPKAMPLLIGYIRFVLIYFLVRKTVTTAEDVRKVANLILFFVGVLILEGIQHKLSPDGLGWAGQTLAWVDQSVIDAGGTGRTRWINIFDGPGVFCVVYTLALPFILRYLDKDRSFFVKLLGLTYLLPLLLAIYYTGSRGGLLASVAVLGLYMALRNNISFMKIAYASSFVLLLYMMAPSYLTSVKDENNSAQHRVDMWNEGVEMLQQNPVLGIGRGNFLRYTGRLIAHNSAVEIMGETGFVGFFLWCGILYMAFKNVIIVAKKTTDAAVLSLNRSLGLSIVGMIVSFMFVTLEYETFYFLLAIPAAMSNSIDERALFTSVDFKRLVIIVIGWVILLKGFIMIY